MAWQFRQSKKFGPLRLTLTKRGISGSVGAGPLRVGLNNRGQVRRTIRVPGAGLYNTEVIGNVRSSSRPQTKAQRLTNTTSEPMTPLTADETPQKLGNLLGASVLGLFAGLLAFVVFFIVLAVVVTNFGGGAGWLVILVGFIGFIVVAVKTFSRLSKEFRGGWNRAGDAQRARRMEQLRDPVFLKTIRDGGILIDNDGYAIALAHRMCRASAEKHLSLRELMTLVQEIELTWTDQDAEEFLGAALMAYAPYEFDRVFGKAS
jgi:Protein of unknown function (DUF4236)/Protein of unknown function (DUF732)